ncbi:hypothetical protein B0J13DRAFT_614639 [Dactylonectria estremocensis]|uniref:Uncharacterized protein n=1 Tax=Dactylonectria estremocensis TaxID=1079267 RepID=A0A9P9FHI2_9HYPO|nr:hypothetical protein B0J13DRAFT_614639 [Dactylonectria estremocensis]
MKVSDVFDACNKSVAVYVPFPLRPHCRAILILVHNYLYRRWFRPYQSEIELERFICKIITPTNLPDEPSPSEATIKSFIALNGDICAHVKAKHVAYNELVAAGQEIPGLSQGDNHRLYMLQPLFQALLIIVCVQSYTYREDSTTMGQFPVLLVRTGVEEGLSAPITFEGVAGAGDDSDSAYYIKTTLETAVDFVMSLEAREAAVFGLQPDPEAAWESYHRRLKGRVGQYEKDLGDEPVTGPSSKFVNGKKYTAWGGNGRHEDRFSSVTEERELRWQDAERRETGPGLNIS